MKLPLSPPSKTFASATGVAEIEAAKARMLRITVNFIVSGR
jgi:hypothetical protein